ncbi:DNA internalization-related competence protein ComEC/Rec2 [Azospira restricta]|uniref:DNA internalization-related competence protein ComEC/Rec2 n=1 Tax=Azospira restricta TaxID=404405 RepID=A0A974PWM2_9RHOO|nr:DNA internalization-related competence protein ComEC/Rec2 [Azospira restricta]QRJ62493.1 DNA internalization-related competence protein ComEC/Rec2 [Azospira restricta]
MRLNLLAFALGVFVLQGVAALPAPPVYLALLAALLPAWLYARRQRPAARLFVALACVAAGFGWAALRADLRLADDLPADWEGRDVRVVGVVAELPQPFDRGDRFVFDVEAVLSAGARVPARVMLSRYAGGGDEMLPALRPGQRWQLTVRLKRPHGNANPHGFDYEAWLLERGIRATGYVRATPPPALVDALVPRPGYLVELARDAIRARFLAELAGADYAGVLVALTVGDQRAIHGDFWRLFARTGTTHLMSISGLHVTMVAALLAWGVGFLWRRVPRLALRLPAQRAAVAAGWLGALFYAFLAGFSVPAQRTLFMLTVAALALLSGRRTAPSRTLALALGLVLALDPWAVLAPGFWLSFGAVALLFYAASERLGEVAGWRAALARWGAAQWAVTLGSLPLLLLFFQQFSLVSPLANALAIPAVSLLVTPLALLAALLPLPGLLQLDHWLLARVMDFLGGLADLPVLELPAPPPWSVVVALAGIVWLLLPRGVPARWLGAVLLLPALSAPAPRPPAGAAWMTVLDVGQGLAVVVQTATRTLLYDTGPLYSAESDAGQRVVLPYLRALGVGRLDALVVTHADSDHAGGAASVLATLPVARVLSSVDDLAGEPCAAGQAWEWDGVRFAMLHPEPGPPRARTKTNNRSCVLRVEAGGRSVLLTSDIEAADEAALLARAPAVLKSDVLLVPHHGSRTSSTPAFVAAVDAPDVIFPVGYRNRFGHPRPDVVARYAGRRLWRTDRDGAVRIVLADAVELSAYRQVHRRYWHGR